VKLEIRVKYDYKKAPIRFVMLRPSVCPYVNSRQHLYGVLLNSILGEGYIKVIERFKF
jgi:hypothetical protein